MLKSIPTKFFPSLEACRLYLRECELREILADTAGRYSAAGFFAFHAQKRIGNPSQLLPPLAASTILARQRGWGYYKSAASAGTNPTSTLQWRGRLKKSITYANIGLRESGAGSDDPKAVYHEFGPKAGKGPPRRSFLASTAREKNNEAFALYAARLIEVIFR